MATVIKSVLQGALVLTPQGGVDPAAFNDDLAAKIKDAVNAAVSNLQKDVDTLQEKVNQGETDIATLKAELAQAQAQRHPLITGARDVLLKLFLSWAFILLFDFVNKNILNDTDQERLAAAKATLGDLFEDFFKPALQMGGRMIVSQPAVGSLSAPRPVKQTASILHKEITINGREIFIPFTSTKYSELFTRLFSQMGGRRRRTKRRAKRRVKRRTPKV